MDQTAHGLRVHRPRLLLVCKARAHQPVLYALLPPARALTEIPGQQDLKETAVATILARARASTGTPGPQIQKKPTPAITATKRSTSTKSTGCKLFISPFARKAAGKLPKSQVQTQRDDAYDLSSDSSEGIQAAMSQLGRFAS